MDANLTSADQQQDPQQAGLIARLGDMLPPVFWFLLFPVCVFSYRATVPLAGAYLLITMMRIGWHASLAAFKAQVSRLPWSLFLSFGIVLASLFWTHDRIGALKVLGAEVAIVAVLAVMLVAVMAQDRVDIPPRLFAASLILTSLLLIIELRSGMAIHGALGLLQKAPRLNQSVMIVTLALFPVLFMVRRDRWVAVLTALIVTIMVMISTKSAAKLALVLAAFGAGLYWLRPVFMRISLFVLVGMGTLTTPWWERVVSDVVIRLEAAGWMKASATERLPILKSFGAAVLDHPWLGYGFNGSYSMIGDPRFPASQGALNYGFLQGHPHNVFLQVFVETGLLGVAVMMALFWALLSSIARLQHGLQTAVGAFLIFNLSVLAISHGAWQAWWWGAVLLAVLVFLMQAAHDDAAVRE